MTEESSPRPRYWSRPGVLLAWGMAILGCLSLLVSNGMTISGLSVYDEVILNEFGWSRGELKFRDLITLAGAGLLAPFAGIAIDRYGVRRCMFIGWLALLVGYWLYSRVSSLVDLYIVHALFALVLVFCGLNAGVILVSRWFDSQRGAAIGLVLVGSSLGGALFPQYGTAMLAALDSWRLSMSWALVFPVAMLLLVLFAVRDGPSSGDSGTAAAAPPASLPGMDFGEALRTPTFWAISFIATSTFYTVLGMQAHLFLHMRELEFSPAQATNMISVFFVTALVGKFGFGILADYLRIKPVFYGNIGVMLAGGVLVALMDPSLILLGVVAMGLGWGGAYTMIQLSAMNSFGLRNAGKILGVISVLDATGGGLGIWVTGLLYDATGSYEVPFTIFACLIAFAVVCISRIDTRLISRS